MCYGVQYWTWLVLFCLNVENIYMSSRGLMNKSMTTLLCVLALMGVASTRGAHRNITEILGATHMNPLYNFTTKPVLEEGSDVLRQMGSGAIKLWYGSGYASNYPQNHSWPTVNNLTELAQTDYFQTMFGDPDFKTYSLEMATFDYHSSWVNGLVGYESNGISTEVYDFATYLLTNYNNSGKTFILQNWEGDNNLGQDALATKVQGMIDWLNCRQDAVTAARDSLAGTVSNVWVYGAAECNKVGDPGWSGPRCYTDVFPYLHMDLYSYSDWYTKYSESKLLEDLNNIKRFAPDSATFGHENVMLGEFGLNRMAEGEAGNFLSSQTEFEIGMDVGARYAFYWQVYEQTDTNISHGLVLNAERAGLFGLPVDQTGRYFTQTQNYFKTNALTLDVFEDLADDFSECNSFSNLTVVTALKDQLDNDPGRFVRMDGSQSGLLEYSFDRDVRRLAVMGFEEPLKNNQLWIYASKTGALNSYTNIPIRRITNEPYGTNTYRRVLTKNADVIPPGYRYFKVGLSSDVQWSPQVSGVRFYYERPPIVQTIEFGGLVADLTNANHQAQVGVDELVQWNGVDSWGATFGEDGTLHNKDSGAFVSSPSTGLRLTTTQISSSDPAGTNTVVSVGVLGIKGTDNAKFDAANAETWAFEFNQDVVLKQLLLSAINYDSETAEVTIGGIATSFTRTDANCSPSGWAANRYIYTFSPPVELSAGTAVEIAATQGQWGLEGVVVRAGTLATAYDLWADTYGLHGVDADWFADPNGNGLPNQTEYGLGGNPVNTGETGIFPTFGMREVGGSNVVEYVYRRRRDAAARGLTYQLKSTSNLVSNSWNSAEATETGIGVVNANLESVTNHIPADIPHKFIQLRIESSE